MGGRNGGIKANCSANDDLLHLKHKLMIPRFDLDALFLEQFEQQCV
jgi:hypothetical protein